MVGDSRRDSAVSRIRGSVLWVVGICAMLLLPQYTNASEFSPPGLYEVERITLPNGLDVVLKPRHGAHTLSLRLWVGVGTQDYPCDKQETPHFLEHLLFTGTSLYDEAELEHRVADHGGSWNAYTANEETVYTMDIYSRFPGFAIDTLYAILTDSQLTNENIEISRDIIHRESGGKPTPVRKWFREQGFGVSGLEKAMLELLPGANYVCETLRSAENIGRGDILETYDTYYVPGNMSLIVVGDFNREQVLARIRNTFGRIESRSLPPRSLPAPAAPLAYGSQTGTFSPLLGTDATVWMLYRIPGYWSDDQYPLLVIEQYLGFRINELIRINRGLAYAPGTYRMELEDYGLFGVYADVDVDDTATALELMREEMQQLVDHPIDGELLEKSKMKILLQSVQGYESNADFADYYATNYVDIRKLGALIDDEAKIQAVNAADIARVANKYLSMERAVQIEEIPTLTYTQLYLVVSFVFVLLLGVLVYFYLRLRAHNRHRSAG
jgi:predicted Zn-dependent peptidase